MFTAVVVFAVVWVLFFAWALCRAAGEADRRIEEMLKMK